MQEENTRRLPARGMSMAAGRSPVRRARPSKLDPRGGQKRQWPTINRWVYPAFTVYFEKNKVIDVVANKADAERNRPEAPIR